MKTNAELSGPAWYVLEHRTTSTTLLPKSFPLLTLSLLLTELILQPLPLLLFTELLLLATLVLFATSPLLLL